MGKKHTTIRQRSKRESGENRYSVINRSDDKLTRIWGIKTGIVKFKCLYKKKKKKQTNKNGDKVNLKYNGNI